ncbi:MAG TPA: class I SAM-dependent methyltransferase [Gaiellaceae bacterium]|nr:class I SAM-dependent methyltransferase [Gaiellaceae bacterium]
MEPFPTGVSAAAREATVTGRPADELRHQYEVERELGNRLRTASRAERLRLYRSVYDERIARVPTHPLAVRARDTTAREAAAVHRLRLIHRFLGPETDFLEIGPGDGSLAQAAAGHARTVYAVDVSLALVAERHWPQNLEWLLTDGVSIPLPSQSVDFAFSDQVLEHLHPDDARDQTRDVYRALRPGASYLCITPNRLSGPWDVSRAFDETATGLHLKEYTLLELVALFRSAGFERIRAFVSYRGRRLSPPVDPRIFLVIEQVIGSLPRSLRKRIGRALDAVRVVGTRLPRGDEPTARATVS